MGIDAQWADDFHHAAHVTATGETGRLLRQLRRGSVAPWPTRSAGMALRGADLSEQWAGAVARHGRLTAERLSTACKTTTK